MNTTPTPTETTKTCRKCSVTKPLAEFPRRLRGRLGVGGQCKSCGAEQVRSWRKRNRHRYRDYQRRTLYGISPEVYAAMLNEQGGVCAVCKKPESVKGKRGEFKALNVDHDHQTGRVRGLLCWRCNITIGRVEESAEVLQAAIEYLRKHKETFR